MLGSREFLEIEFPIGNSRWLWIEETRDFVMRLGIGRLWPVIRSVACNSWRINCGLGACTSLAAAKERRSLTETMNDAASARLCPHHDAIERWPPCLWCRFNRPPTDWVNNVGFFGQLRFTSVESVTWSPLLLLLAYWWITLFSQLHHGFLHRFSFLI